MPIESSIGTAPITRDAFHTIDYEVMGIIFRIHNEMGRFYDEKIYQNELRFRCLENGFEVTTEKPIRVCHGAFRKDFFVDLVIGEGIVYELKTMKTIVPQHRQQILNYLFLCDRPFGKIVNMRPQSVESEFAHNVLSRAERYRFTVEREAWQDLGEESVWLRRLVGDLLEDWGAFLDPKIFHEAIECLSPWKDTCTRPIEVVTKNGKLGDQKVHLLTPNIGIQFSSAKKSLGGHQRHLRRFIQHTYLHAIHWINFNGHDISMKTIIE